MGANSVDIVQIETNQMPSSIEASFPNVVNEPIEERLTKIRQAVVGKYRAALSNVKYGQGKWLLENPNQGWGGNLAEWGASGPYSHIEHTCIGLKLLSLADTSEANALLARFHDLHAADHVLIGLLPDDDWQKAGVATNRDASQPTAEFPTNGPNSEQLLPDQAASGPVLSGRYIDNRDGTATDTTTGLMWMRCALGQTWDGTMCVGNGRTYTWYGAMAIHHTWAGYSDWRLPELDELNSIVDKERRYPALDSVIYPHTNPQANSRGFWSATQHKDGVLRWYVAFGYGKADCLKPIHDLYVRLVRRGQLPQEIKESNHVITGDQSLTTSQTKDAVRETNPGVELIDRNVDNPPESEPHIDEPTGVLVMDEAKTLTANISAVIPDLDIGIAFESVESSSMKNGESAYIIYVTITNRLKKQVRVELPLSDYVTAWGEEIEQDVWLSGLLIGAKSTSIRAGAFKRAGVIFYQPKLRGISQGDHLYMSVVLSPSSRQFNFSFLCTDQTKRTFTLVEASMDDATKDEVPSAQQPVVQAASLPSGLDTLPRVTEIIERLESMERRFLNSLDRMERLLESPALNRTSIRTAVDFLKQHPESFATEIDELRSLLGYVVQSSVPDSTRLTLQPAVSPQTYTSLLQLLHGLIELEAISLADLRRHLLPLDLLPNAVIEEINEKAFDLVGEPALEEDGEQVIVFREVLAHVLDTWDTPSV